MTRRPLLLRIVKDACKITWEAYQLLPTVFAAVISVVLLFHRPIAQKLLNTQNAVSPWWCLAVLIAFVAYRLIYSSYRIAYVAESERDTLKDARDRKIKIGEFLIEGRRLCDQKLTDSEVPHWFEACTKWWNQVIGFLRAEWPEKLAFFKEYDRTAYDFIGSINKEHNNGRLQMSGYCKNLKEMLGD